MQHEQLATGDFTPACLLEFEPWGAIVENVNVTWDSHATFQHIRGGEELLERLKHLPTSAFAPPWELSNMEDVYLLGCCNLHGQIRSIRKGVWIIVL